MVGKNGKIRIPRAKRISTLTSLKLWAQSGFPKRKGKAKAFVVKNTFNFPKLKM